MNINILELGTKIILTEDFKFSYLKIHTSYAWNSDIYNYWESFRIGDEVILPKDTVLILKKYEIKRGRSHSNHCVFSVHKTKNTEQKFISATINIWIQELPEMIFEKISPNIETKNFLFSVLDHPSIIETYGNFNNTKYKSVESIVLNSKNKMNFSTSQDLAVYYRSLEKRINTILEYKYSDIDYKPLLAIVEGEYRKLKIRNLLS